MGHGLTVLLEKELGFTYTNKLRTICLFEASFNFLQNIIFSKRMIHNTHQRKIIPTKQCVTAGVDQNQRSMLKTLQCGIHRTMHISYLVVSMDLANYYNSINHVIAVLSLLCFDVPHMTNMLMLNCIQSRYSWFRTVFATLSVGWQSTHSLAPRKIVAWHHQHSRLSLLS